MGFAKKRVSAKFKVKEFLLTLLLELKFWNYKPLLRKAPGRCMQILKNEILKK